MAPRKLKYPIGIQDFAEIRTHGYVYVDKTGFISQLLQQAKYVFLSRPRRFGKSLLLSTIKYYFEGRQDLFTNLAISDETSDWTPWPVLYLSLNTGQYDRADGLENVFYAQLAQWEAKYGRADGELDIAQRITGVIRRAHAMTGRKVVFLVDEYDKPLISTIDSSPLYEGYRSLLKAVYSCLKTCDADLRFAMLTGVTRFSKVSIFSDLNNLSDISMIDAYGAICGISEPELQTNLAPGIDELAQAWGLDRTRTLETLRRHYDGYHFTRTCPGLYNPFNLLSALAFKELNDFWYATGTTTFLARRVKSDDWRLPELQRAISQPADLSDIDSSRNPVPLLFQTGYLTIKEYDPRTGDYILGFPNAEVRNGFVNSLFGVYVREGLHSDFDMGTFRRDVIRGDTCGFMRRLEALFANIPAPFKPRKHEYEFQNLLYIIFMMLGQVVHTEINIGNGRADMVVLSDQAVYIFEFKYGLHQPAEALHQIKDRGYGRAYIGGNRPVVAIGAVYHPQKGIFDWLAETLA